MKIEGQIRIPSGCAISAVISKTGERMSGESIIESMRPMHDRSNGLGGGFAAYGIYPEHKDEYALHIFFNDGACRTQCEHFLKDSFEDYLLRRQGLTLPELASVIAAPFRDTIKLMDERAQRKATYLRTVFSSLLITGPFSIVLGFTGGLMALNDRLKLRSMVVGEKGDKVYIASEEAAIRAMEPEIDSIYAPRGGEPVIIKVKEGTF